MNLNAGGGANPNWNESKIDEYAKGHPGGGAGPSTQEGKRVTSLMRIQVIWCPTPDFCPQACMWSTHTHIVRQSFRRHLRGYGEVPLPTLHT